MKKNSLDVAILYYGLFPWARAIGQLYSLIEELGHKPHVFAAYPEPRYENLSKNRYRTYYFRNSNAMLKKMMALHLPFNFFWEFWLTKMCKNLQIDCLFIKETPLAYIGQRVARKLEIKVMLDMRENLPATYSNRRSKKIPLPSALQYSLSSFYEALVLPRFDHILTVTDELRKLVIEKYGIPLEKIDVLGNYPGPDFIRVASQCEMGKCKAKNGSVRFVFAGFVSEDRGVQDIIAALSKIPKEMRPIFTIIGEGSYLMELRRKAEFFKIDSSVEFSPFLSPEKLPQKLAEFDVGVCSYWLNEQTHYTMPGKLFEYMAAGLAIFSSARKPVMRILDDLGCGIIYNSNNPVAIANAIIEISSDRMKLQEMGKRSKKAILEHYNYRTNLKVLESIFEKKEN